MYTIFVYLIPALIVLSGIYFSFWTSAIRDVSNNTPRSYSFSRAQLMWWTIIILSCVSAQFGMNGPVTDLNPHILALLGIGTGTATLANLIDKNDAAAGNIAQQVTTPSRGFLYDILDDGNGISVHRFQAMVFNLLFGITFISGFITDGKLPDFSDFQLGLLGISSSAYLAIKASENKQQPQTPQDAAGGN